MDLILIRRYLEFLESRTLYNYLKSQCWDCYYIEILDSEILRDETSIQFTVLINSFGHYDEKKIVLTNDDITRLSNEWAKEEE